jgi:hypothetical protein
LIDDSWININANQLDELLNNISGRPATTVTDLDLVAKQMKSFVDKVSSYEGAEFAGFVQHIYLLWWWLLVSFQTPNCCRNELM